MIDHNTHLLRTHTKKHTTTTTTTEKRSSIVDMKSGGVAAAMAAAALVLVLAAAVARPAQGAVSCGDVDASLRPCVGYVTGKEASPPAECCEGVKRLKAMPADTAEKRQACECVKLAAAQYQGIQPGAAANLPGACGAPLPFQITQNFDCKTIS
ncbi:hypothetical protein ACP4OV_018237 [Aristida adscensionis]